MRLFIGIGIGEYVAHGAGALLDELRARAWQMAPNAKITWVAPERLHVTVRFIGEVDAARALTIQQALEHPLQSPAFTLAVCGIGAFPPHGGPKVIWAGIAEGRDRLVAIEREVTERLREFGPREEREYRPHVTLARVKEADRLRTRDLLTGLEDQEVGLARINAVTLFESRLSPKGPVYVPLVRGALRGG